jgi:hypothetical protein
VLIATASLLPPLLLLLQLLLLLLLLGGPAGWQLQLPGAAVGS